jgi:hypothetical protein
MSDFIGYMTDILGISLTIGTTTLTLGGVAIATIVLAAGVRFFKSLSRGR